MRASAALCTMDYVRGCLLEELRKGMAMAMGGIGRAAGALLLALAGGGVAYVLVGGARRDEQGERTVEAHVAIDKQPDEVYAYWRDLSNLPTFMRNLIRVTTSDDGRSHWVAQGPLGRKAEWTAEITEDQPGQLLAWRSLDGSGVPTGGAVRFAAMAGGRGTYLHVSFAYSPPAGALGEILARLTGRRPQAQVQTDLGRFRAALEAGEAPTTTGQPAGQRSALGQLANQWAAAR